MANLTLENNVNWLAPMPLWARNSSVGILARNQNPELEPTILRFASDTFMDDLLEMLTHYPWRISDWVVQPETWRQPMPTPRPVLRSNDESKISYMFKKTKLLTQQQLSPKTKLFNKTDDKVAEPDQVESNDTEKLPLKLFQAGHDRFYLVAASLISREPGFPDCALDLSRNERTTFVVRRLAPPPKDDTEKSESTSESDEIDFDEWDEYAFTLTPTGAAWRRIDKHSNKQTLKELIPGEEQLPLFPVNYQNQCGHFRQIHSGLIPVGKRETWMGAPTDGTSAGQNGQNQVSADQIRFALAKVIFQNDVAEPWRSLVEQAQFAKDNLQKTASSYFDVDSDELKKDKDRVRRTTRDAIQTGSWYVLLDFAKFLEKYLPDVWDAANKGSANTLDDNNQAKLFNILNNTKLSPNQRWDLANLPRNSRYSTAKVKSNLLKALVAIRDLEDDLELVDKAFMRYDDKDIPMTVDEKWPGFLFPLADIEMSGLELIYEKIDSIVEIIEDLLPTSADEVGETGSQTVLDQRDGWFVVRCVYERPRCGPIFPALVSEPTCVFQMASFFDPDAPSRPVRIPMPIDISPAGLRKYKKNASFVISDMLCGQIKRIRKTTFGDLVLSVLPWPFHKDLPEAGNSGPCEGDGVSFGMICSLSIPIVTLCALILLIIMVSLFDLFFRWLPFLFTCLPIPGFKAKKR